MAVGNSFADKWSEEILNYGFTSIPNLLIKYRRELRISTTEFYILVAIEKHRWDDVQKPWPSLSGLAKLTGLSVKTVNRATIKLQEFGLLEIIHRPGTSNLYDMTPLVEELDFLADQEKMS